ncbi:MAG: metalloregulator ArsR/SmtB family transcription factor [Candidatus Pacebacteria bacterium]|nr:metalloregulator ArsR/SmtB family transcription factor [Candidatus Paceibacterota bacterium]MCD8507980.1 metalloregulator ArsR/SmtB family transcription factor [Candidatus Paceibacterota bacterium]MCD8527750.1 metalloregulator ArsR/SmtB family transcription factor [Candidatus Paceibacterota bacterium]MCD8564025.1 metalloregulator ArsR/SmtB family transcription factor [Candidatus Paceibacterota bacterium]
MRTYSTPLHKKADLFLVFGNVHRLAILVCMQKYTQASVSFIASEINASFHATSKHLKILERAGLVDSHTEGLFRMYHIVPQKNNLLRYLLRNITLKR